MFVRIAEAKAGQAMYSADKRGVLLLHIRFTLEELLELKSDARVATQIWELGYGDAASRWTRIQALHITSQKRRAANG